MDLGVFSFSLPQISVMTGVYMNGTTWIKLGESDFWSNFLANRNIQVQDTYMAVSLVEMRRLGEMSEYIQGMERCVTVHEQSIHMRYSEKLCNCARLVQRNKFPIVMIWKFYFRCSNQYCNSIIFAVNLTKPQKENCW